LVGLARDYQRTVIFTIHQPRSNIYALFDQLLLLAKGRVVYSGPAQQPVIDHFSSLGYHCPLGFNIADYLVDLTMHAAKNLTLLDHDAEAPSHMGESIISTSSRKHNIRDEQESLLYSPLSAISNRGLKYPESILENEPNSQNNGATIQGMTPELNRLCDEYHASNISSSINREIDVGVSIAYPTPDALLRAQSRALSTRLSVVQIQNTSLETLFAPSNAQKQRATWLTQFTILSGRTFRNLVRNPDLLLTHYAISVVVALISGFLFWQLDFTMAGFQNRLGVMFFISALFGFQCLSSMQVFASERLVFMRERANRYYSPITYFFSKVVLSNADTL
jgi:ABC-2 type transporter